MHRDLGNAGGGLTPPLVSQLQAFRFLSAMRLLRFATPIGTCTLEWDLKGIERVRFPSEQEQAPCDADRLGEDQAPTEVAKALERILATLEGRKSENTVFWLNWSKVSDFQRKVYEETLRIPLGETRTYGELAQTIGLPPGGGRAVGKALGANPWPILVPCHRVLGTNGKLTGFSAPGGTLSKARLLAIEGRELPGLF